MRVMSHRPPRSSGGVDGVDVVGLQLQLAHQQVEDARRHGAVDLQAHRQRRAAAALQDALHGFEQVLGLVALEVEVGVAGEPEGVVGDDLHAGEEHVQVGPR